MEKGTKKKKKKGGEGLRTSLTKRCRQKDYASSSKNSGKHEKWGGEKPKKDYH